VDGLVAPASAHPPAPFPRLGRTTPERPATGKGTTWAAGRLRTSRQGLTPRSSRGRADHRRPDLRRRPATDTILLVARVPPSGRAQPTTDGVHPPRLVTCRFPGNGEDKINSAYTFGGAPAVGADRSSRPPGSGSTTTPRLGSTASAVLVDAVGGVTMCPAEPISDPLAGIDRPCRQAVQKLNGRNALGFMCATRGHATPPDLDRDDQPAAVHVRRFFIAQPARRCCSTRCAGTPMAHGRPTGRAHRQQGRPHLGSGAAGVGAELATITTTTVADRGGSPAATPVSVVGVEQRRPWAGAVRRNWNIRTSPVPQDVPRRRPAGLRILLVSAPRPSARFLQPRPWVRPGGGSSPPRPPRRRGAVLQRPRSGRRSSSYSAPAPALRPRSTNSGCSRQASRSTARPPVAADGGWLPRRRGFGRSRRASTVGSNRGRRARIRHTAGRRERHHHRRRDDPPTQGDAMAIPVQQGSNLCSPPARPVADGDSWVSMRA